MTKAAFYHGNREISFGTSQAVPPQAGEVQIQVSHCGVCGTDLHIFHGAMDQRVTFPQIMGHEASGTVVAVGNDVEGLHVGDRVAVMPLDTSDCLPRDKDYSHICENLQFLGIDTQGGFQTFWTVPAFTLHKLPETMELKYGALIEPLAVACHDVRMGKVKAGDDVVVLGGGPIGMLVALVAKHRRANVLVSEINPFRLQLAQQLGLQAVNPIEEDLVARTLAWTNDRGADVVFEVTGSAAGASVMTQLPRIRGRIVVVGIFSKSPEVDLFRFFWRELSLFGARVYENEDFSRAIELAASGELPLDTLITDILPLEELKNALEQMESGGEVMKILMEVSE